MRRAEWRGLWVRGVEGAVERGLLVRRAAQVSEQRSLLAKEPALGLRVAEEMRCIFTFLSQS